MLQYSSFPTGESQNWNYLNNKNLLQYHATGRGFVVRHIKFTENYRLYARSHFVKGSLSLSLTLSLSCVHMHASLFLHPQSFHIASLSNFFRMEIVLLLAVFLAYGYNKGLSYILLTVSSWFLALSWLFAPYLFNPSGFEWQK